MSKDKFVSRASTKKDSVRYKHRMNLAAKALIILAAVAIAVLLVIAAIKNGSSKKEPTENPEIISETAPSPISQEEDVIPPKVSDIPEPEKEKIITAGENGVSMDLVYLISAMYKDSYRDFANAEGSWNTVLYDDGTTADTLLTEKVLETVKTLVLCEYLHDSTYFLTLSENDTENETQKLTEYIEYFGSEEGLVQALTASNADTGTLNRYLVLEAKTENLTDHFYGENGIYKISEDAIKQKFASEYAIITHIFFDTEKVTLDDGSTREMTPEEKALKTETATTVFQSITNADSFYEAKALYNEDYAESIYYPNGFFVTKGSHFPASFTAAALEMKDGEIRLAETETGIHILMRLPMDENLYNSDNSVYSAIKNELISADLLERCNPLWELISISDETLEKIYNIDIDALSEFPCK